MRLILLLLIVYCTYLMFKNRAGRELPREPSAKGEETYQDPVCGVYVARDDAIVGNLQGERLYFCSMACLEKYRERLENK